MPAYVETFNQILSLGTIALQGVIVILALNLVFLRSNENPVLSFFKKYTVLFVFLIGLGGALMSLFYSEVIGFPPCELCWVQRVFIYPQIFLAGYLLWRPITKRTRVIAHTSFLFAIFGTLVSIYHVYIENGGESSLPCADPNTTKVVSCGARYVYEYGYITIPVMALTAGALMLLIWVNYRYMSKK